MRTWTQPAALLGLPVFGPAIPEVGGGWVIRLPITSDRLEPLRAAGWTIIPSGRKNVIVQRPPAEAES